MEIIEKKSQLKRFIKHYKSEDCIIVPVSCDDNKHPMNDSLSLLYVKLLSGKEFILPFNHSETLDLEISSLDSNTKKYTYDRKKLNHYIKLTNVIDVNSITEAVITSNNHASNKDSILFSPASPSFDMFKNFEDRGNQFKALIKREF